MLLNHTITILVFLLLLIDVLISETLDEEYFIK